MRLLMIFACTWCTLPNCLELVNSKRYKHAKNLTADFKITDSIRCYSCMSKHYEGLFDKLRMTYHRPKNFSQLCDHGKSQKGISLVSCDSICISMAERIYVAGYPITGHIRGCFTNMLLRGFNQTLVRWYRWLQRDSCHQYPKKEVLQLPFHSEGHVQICTCYADGCNGSPRLSGAPDTKTFSWLRYCWPSLLLILWNFLLESTWSDRFGLSR